MSFNEYKNNTEILRKYLLKMNSVTESDIKPQWVEQTFLKQNNPHIFMQILHYIIVKFSPSTLFVKVLDFYPTIKDDNDKKFVTNIMSLARKMFDIDVKIDIDQFLSSKFVEKKTQFTSCFCKAAYDYHLKENKSLATNQAPTNNFSRRQNEISSNLPSKLVNKYSVNDDSEDEMPRNLNIAPSTTKRPVISKKDIQETSSDEDLKQLINKKREINKIKEKSTFNKPVGKLNVEAPRYENKKANVFPKKIEQDGDSDNEFYPVAKQNKTQTQKIIGKNQQNNSKEQRNFEEAPQTMQKNSIINKKSHSSESYQNQQVVPQQAQFDPSQYVTRQQFMEIVTGMTRNFTELLTKFNDFQGQVGGWVQNVNAKISILQENVKTIKNNL